MAGGGAGMIPSTTPIAPNKTPLPTYGSPSTFGAAANTQASDYDRIMKSYQDLLSSNQNSQPYTPITTTLTPYSRSSELSGALSTLSDLSKSGGYSDQNLSDVRTRSISPIRSIYANAKTNLNRSRSLAGGYSPNYAAATAKMAREESSQIGDISANVEGDIAQKQAQGRLAIAPSFASLAGTENQARTAVEQANQNIINQINEFNAQMAQQRRDTIMNNNLQAVEGQRGLYSSTPGLTSLFGNQVSDAARLAQGQQGLNANNRNANMGFTQSMLAGRG